MGSIAQRDVLAAVSDQLGIPLVTGGWPPAGRSRNRGADGAFPAPVACVPHGAVEFDAQAAMADTLDFEAVAAGRAFSGLLIQTVLGPSLDANDKHYPSTSEYRPRVPRSRSERASRFVKDQ